MSTINFEGAVSDRYSKAANEREEALCCPVQYNQEYLKVIPQEIIDRDYGCGDPSPFVNPGETVLDLGSGGGKLCYIASQVVGSEGSVIGVDCNQEMLDLARSYQQEVAEKIGFSNVTFRCGIIQNLALDLEQLESEIQKIEETGVSNILERRRLEQKLATATPMIEDDSIDCVVSNCVLNLVQPKDRIELFEELHRVLKVGGRAAISDIVSDETVPEHLQNNPELWSGCISGAWREDQFLKQFTDAGFGGVVIAKREEKPWQVVEGIEFRSVTVVAYKKDESECLEQNQAVIYKGPFRSVQDDDGHVFHRGKRMAVCGRTFDALMSGPYRDQFYPVHPLEPIDKEIAEKFDCSRVRFRHPRETKGKDYNVTETICDKDQCC
ncbi:MAG: methyltransferase domain-containing protein [Planctomycetota bacterium]